VDSSNFQGLSLCLVDGHSKCEANRELYPFEVERDVCRDEWYSRNEYILSFSTTSEDSRLNQVGVEILHTESSAVAQLGGIQVSKKHDRHPDF
jgi:hypothetical protein